jgi:hypothetical protein
MSSFAGGNRLVVGLDYGTTYTGEQDGQIISI